MRLASIVLLFVVAGCIQETPESGSIDSAPAHVESTETDAGVVLVDLPPYSVEDRVERLAGGTYGDIVVPSYSTQTDSDTLSAAAEAIADTEGLSKATFYQSEEAVRANFSSSFAEANPGILEAGLLGTYENGSFQPSSR